MYKTISFKLLKPTKVKAEILDDAGKRYSEAFEIILRNIKPKIADWYKSDEKYNKTKFLKIIDKDAFSGTKHLGIEPFKDSLKLDLSRVISVYFSKKNNKEKNSYPVSSTDDDDIEAILSRTLPDAKTLIKSLNKYKRSRAILFCRYDIKRDYSIIHQNGKFFAKLYLFNRNNTIDGKRYIVCPFIVPDKYRELFEEKYYPDNFKSAELVKKGDCFYLNIRIWFETHNQTEFSTYMGVVRGIKEEISYAICDINGEIITYAGISFKNVHGINKLHMIANKVIEIANKYGSQIISENISSRNDGLANGTDIISISASDYAKLVFFIKYKAELAGLKEPVAVSPNGIFYVCPRCGINKRANRFGTDKFICISCGYSDFLEHIGATNLARTLIKYKSNQINVNVKQKNDIYIFYVKALKYTYECEASANSLENFYKNIYLYLKMNFNKFDNNQKSIVYKIRDSGKKAFKINFS